MRAPLVCVLLLAAGALAPRPLVAQDESPRPRDLIQEIRDRLDQLEMEVREREKEVVRRLGLLDLLAKAAHDLSNEAPMTGRDAARGRLAEAVRRAALEPPLEGATPRVLERCERILDRGTIGTTGEELAREFAKELLPLERETLSRVQSALLLARWLDDVGRKGQGLAAQTQSNAALALERLYFSIDTSLGAP